MTMRKRLSSRFFTTPTASVALFVLGLTGCGNSDSGGGGGQPAAGEGGGAGAGASGASAGSGGSAGTGGSGGGAAGTGGSGGGSAGTGGSGGGSAGTGGTGASGGNGGSAGGGGVGGDGGSGGANVDEEPCPSGAVLDCSGQCGGEVAPLCFEGYCDRAPGNGIFFDSSSLAPEFAPLPVTLRTPARPGLGCVGCGLFGIAVTVPNAIGATEPLRVSVRAPWWVRTTTDVSAQPRGFCDSDGEAGQCTVTYGGTVQVYVLTDDPDAPSRNVVFERLGACP